MIDSKAKDKFHSVNEINKIIHEPARLLILAYLYMVESADFLFILNQTGLTKGNLSSHLNKLETIGYVDIEKDFIRKKSRTVLKLTLEGRKEFEIYSKNMKQVLNRLPD